MTVGISISTVTTIVDMLWSTLESAELDRRAGEQVYVGDKILARLIALSHYAFV
jgi:hypothetical protein